MKKIKAFCVIAASLVMITGLSVIYEKETEKKETETTYERQGLPICSGESGRREAALSFHVADDTEQLASLLHMLEEEGISATFFVHGKWVREYPDFLKNMVEKGHEVGNHGEHYRQMTQMPKKKCREEILMLHERVKELTGYEMKVFTPPYGITNARLVRWVRDWNYRAVGWSVDSMDWKEYGEEDMVKRMTDPGRIVEGDILLFRTDTDVEALRQIIHSLKKQGFQMVTISRIIEKQNLGKIIRGTSK